MRKISIFLLFLCFPFFMFSQTDSNNESNFGIGFHVEQFKLNELISSSSSEAGLLNKLVLVFTPHNNFRIEPEIGFRYVDGESVKAFMFGIGSGFFVTREINKLNVYGGLRIDLAFGNSEENYSMYGDDIKLKHNILSLAPAFGIEYLFSSSFSVGGEVALKYTESKIKPDGGSGSSTTTSFSTETGLLFRYYF